jgi:hypothetical protein
LLDAANRRMIGVREPANGESRLNASSASGVVSVGALFSSSQLPP